MCAQETRWRLRRVRVRVRLGRGIRANNLWSRGVVGQRQAPPAAHPPSNALFTLGTIGPAPLTAPRCPADLVTASQSGPQTSRVRPRPKQSGPPRRFVDCQRIAALASPPDPTLHWHPPLPGDLSPSGVWATACAIINTNPPARRLCPRLLLHHATQGGCP